MTVIRDLRFAVIADSAAAHAANHPRIARPLTHPAQLRWRPRDPHAVELRLGDTPWLFALDLLETGLDKPAGLWDVRVRPAAGYRTEIMLDSPSGYAVLHLSAVDVRRFLEDVAAVWADVHIDDRELAAWIAGAEA